MSQDIVDTCSGGVHGPCPLCRRCRGDRRPVSQIGGLVARHVEVLGGQAGHPIPGRRLRVAGRSVDGTPPSPDPGGRGARERDRGPAQAVVRGGLRRRTTHHPVPPAKASRNRSGPVQHPPGPGPAWLRRPPAPEAATDLLGALRVDAAQRDLAGGHDPLVPRRRHRGGDPRFRRRLLPDGHGRRCVAGHDRGRCGGRLLPGCRAFRAAGVDADRQRLHLHRPVPQRPLRVRDRARHVGHHHQARQALPPPERSSASTRRSSAGCANRSRPPRSPSSRDRSTTSSATTTRPGPIRPGA